MTFFFIALALLCIGAFAFGYFAPNPGADLKLSVKNVKWARELQIECAFAAGKWSVCWNDAKPDHEAYMQQWALENAP